ncbi:Synaptonemal complex protein 2-like [Merluccius polli]|uniref:Synaptonemal complex protein 2-like n=1 Tax=Merluccius polli TaxID=89951 RepID=A0AA47NQ48_MERPO|nr:Synaptonemal complex protein 2-like [Merluccius polli]
MKQPTVRALDGRQFEVSVEDFFVQKDCVGLAMMLHDEALSETLVVRLDKMVAKELAVDGFRRVSMLLKALGSISEKPEDLHLLLKHGLGVVLWFEAVCELLSCECYRNTGALQSLAEDFYDYFLLARLVLEPAITFSLRLEGIRTYNSLVESLNREERKQLQVDRNQHQILDQLAASILTVGDYELQVSLSEALCRLTPRKDREQRANHWFSSRDIIDAFCKIRDGDFEVLFSPKDDKLDQFWIDFNLGSECISFFIDDPEVFF